MRALRIDRKVGKFGAARIVSAVSPGGAAKLGPLEHRTIDDPERPAGEGWHQVRTRLAGICGSDLALVDGHASTYFENWVSFPFVPGHEVVGELESGDRVILEPVLGHAARGLNPPFEGACPADGDDHAHLATTSANGIEPGIQTGFCCSTGGGWAPWFWAHESQLHRIDAPVDEFPDERAVLVEPFAGGIHAALMAAPITSRVAEPVVAVIGAGTMGLAAIAGLNRYVPDVRIVAGARYEHQRRLAAACGADRVAAGSDLDRAVRREVGCHLIGDPDQPILSSGAHVTIDAVGSAASIADAIRITRPGGRIVLLGMPADVTLDLIGLWHREIEMKGAYTYGTETLPDGTTTSTFELAIDTVSALEAERLVSATYSLDDHVDAIAHAAAAGRRGATKICFEMRGS